MKNIATIYHANGTQTEVKPKNGKDFKLDEMQKIVGGYIEVFRLDDNKIAVVNEEGKLINLPINHMATFIGWASGELPRADAFVGDVLICPSKMVK